MVDMTGLCARPFGAFPYAGNGATATITAYNASTGVLSGNAAPNSLVVLAICGTYQTSTLADATGRWSMATGGISGYAVSVSALPFGSVLYPGVVAGSKSYSTAGSTRIPVPSYNSLVIELNGAGGAPGTSSGSTGTPGTNTTIASLGLIANCGGNNDNTASTASGGDTNTNGQAGTTSYGGSSPNGGGQQTNSGAGLAPGGGGYNNSNYYGGDGGAYLKKTYTAGSAGAPTPNTILSSVVGMGGACVLGPNYSGATGQIKLTWT